jgi:DNA-binding transcriptional MerR regulator
MSMNSAARLRIGELAQGAGVTVRTVRWYCDQGLLSPAGRSAAGYRLFDAEALARLELVRTLREIGLDLPAIKQVLDRELKLPEVAAAHADALEAQIRTLRLRHAVLRAVAARGAQPGEVGLMHRLARLSAAERRRIVAEFLDQVFTWGTADPGFEAGMRAQVPDLPDEPMSAQLEAWVELAELIADPDFRRRIQGMAAQVAHWPSRGESPHEAIARAAEAIVPQAGAALEAGLDPDGPEAAIVLNEMLATLAPLEGSADGPRYRAGLAERLQIVADPRVERYWQLLAVLDGSPGPGSYVPRLAWVITALRTHPSPPGRGSTPEAAR